MGYKVCLLFLWLPSVELAIERVANRVRQGGHDIPEPTIRQRFQRGLANFHHLYCPIVDEWILLDNSHSPLNEIARRNYGIIAINDGLKWSEFRPERQA